MRGLLLLALAIFLALLAVMIGSTAGVFAMGAPTENYTIPDIPTSDPTHEEIKPPVNFILQGPTTQAEGTEPGFTVDFSNASAEDQYKVTGNENWYLEIDINTPGWLYIYEYYPGDKGFQGKWIAYKWQLIQSGQWKLGPFSPMENEAEGQHVYRIWFYSEGQWAAEDPSAPQDNLVYWTYIKDYPVVNTQPPPATTSVKEETFADQLRRFILNPAVLVTGPSLIAVLVLLGLYLSRTYGKKQQRPAALLLSSGADIEQPPDIQAPIAARARLTLPNGMEIRLADSRIIGRGDLARALDIDELGLISKQHFEVTYSGDRFFIEDAGSANGTRLNGTEIKGKGQVNLDDGDVIEPAGAVQIKFFEL